MVINPGHKQLVELLIEEGYLKSKQVIDAFMSVDRQNFISYEQQSRAYEDTVLPIGDSQTISAPHMVAIMTELLKPSEDSKILEVGSGSGYQAAILSKLCPTCQIYTMEYHHSLAKHAAERMRLLGHLNVRVLEGDGSLGCHEHAPFDRIIVTAAAPHIPRRLVSQLAEGGRLLLPVGGRLAQTLKAVDKKNGKLHISLHGGCIFVPLRGDDGWSDSIM